MITKKLRVAIVYPRTIPENKSQAGSIDQPLHFIIQAAFYLFLFSLPFEAVLASTATWFASSAQGFWSLSRITGFLLIITFIFSRRRMYLKSSPAVWGFIVYAVVSVISALVFLTLYDMAFSFSLFMVPWLILIFLVCYEIFQDPITRNRGMKVFMIAIGVCAILQLTIPSLRNYDVMTSTSSELRTAVFGNDPNLIGAQYLVGVFLAIFTILNIIPAGRIVKIVALVVVGCCILTLVQSGSRGAVLSGGVAFLPFLLSKKSIKKRLVIWMTILLVTGVIILLIYINEGFRDRFLLTLNTGDTAMRSIIYQTSYRLISASPFFGYGPDRNNQILATALGLLRSDTHNTLLWVLSANGLLGLIPFVFGLGASLYQAYRGRNGPDDVAPLVLCVFAIAFSQTVSWQVEKIFWVLLAFAASATVVKVKQMKFDRMQNAKKAASSRIIEH